MAHLNPGHVLRNRYRIVGLIGAGGMGAVYLADDNRLEGRRCAIKEQTLTTPLSQSAQSQFQQEASILARLDHPGLPKVSDYFSEEGGACDYLVMDYVPGQNLEQLVKQASRKNEFLAEETVMAWLEQLCDVLAHLHTRRPMVLHRDIKPANIKLTPDNRLKLVDFGLAKPFDPTDPRTITGLQGLGSLPYTPLEQYVGHTGHTDARADLYALGATCYHLLTGHVPPSAHDRFLNPNILRPPHALNPNLSPHVSRAILWAMQLHPDDRAPSVAAWHAAARGESAVALSASAPGETLPPAPPPSLRAALQQNAWLFGLALLLFILALMITFAG